MESEALTTERVFAERYRVTARLGRGGMAEVYDGHDERLARPVAVKVLRPDMADRPEVRGRFESEARSAARLTHPNVVAVYDTGEDDGQPFLVMERLPGETLGDRMTGGPLGEDWVLRMAGDVLGALGAAHAAGIVHRDIKPGNILLSEVGCAKVADFGIAKSAEVAAGDDATLTGMLLGTPAYLAPERIDGLAATPQSDLYSFGVVLYEALSGARPFAADSTVAVAMRVRETQPTPLADLNPHVQPHVVRAIERAMAKDPAARPATAAEMAADLGIAPASAGTAMLASNAGTATVALDALAVAPAARRRGVPVAALVIGGLIAFALAFAVGAAATHRSGATSTTTAGVQDNAALASQIDQLAISVRDDPSTMSSELADRLRALATEVRAGDQATTADANALVAGAARWHQQGERVLSTTAYSRTLALLTKIPGVQAPVAATTTTAPAPTAPAPAPGGKRHKGKGDG